MGLSNETGGRKNFLNISKGRIVAKDKDGNLNYFTTVSGLLTSISTKDGKFGKELHIGLHDKGEDFLLQMKIESGYAKCFMKAIKNVDLRLPLQLTPKHEVDGDRQTASMFLNQDGKAIKWFWTKENPGTLPPPTSREWKGKTEWDYTAQLAYLENMLLTEIVPRLQHPAVAGAVQSTEPQPKYMKEQTKLEDMPEDDLPF